jgi:hypothetical protein
LVMATKGGRARLTAGSLGRRSAAEHAATASDLNLDTPSPGR